MYEMARMLLFLVAERGMQIANIATGMRRLEVGKMGLSTGLGESMDHRLEGVRSLQVPPRAPKRQSKGCLFFCQSIVAKSHKTP